MDEYRALERSIIEEYRALERSIIEENAPNASEAIKNPTINIS